MAVSSSHRRQQWFRPAPWWPHGGVAPHRVAPDCAERPKARSIDRHCRGVPQERDVGVPEVRSVLDAVDLVDLAPFGDEVLDRMALGNLPESLREPDSASSSITWFGKNTTRVSSHTRRIAATTSTLRSAPQSTPPISAPIVGLNRRTSRSTSGPTDPLITRSCLLGRRRAAQGALAAGLRSVIASHAGRPRGDRHGGNDGRAVWQDRRQRVRCVRSSARGRSIWSRSATVRASRSTHARSTTVGGVRRAARRLCPAHPVRPSGYRAVGSARG